MSQPPKNLKAPSSICILRLSAIGDVTHVLPTLHTIKDAWPQTAITWVIGKLEYQLVKDIPGVEFIIFDKKRGWRAYGDLHRALKGRSFDILLHMQVSMRASIASLAITARRRIGFDRARAKNLQWLFTNEQIASIPRQHVLDSFLEFPKALGLQPGAARWEIPVLPETRQKVQERFSLPEQYAVINPCSSSRLKNWRNWSAENYAKVVDFLWEKYGLKTVLTGGPTDQEREMALEILRLAAHQPISTTAQTSLPEVMAIIAQARLVIAPDTGPAHMANAAGVPVIGLYATSNPYRTGPYSNLENCVNAYPEAVRKEMGCPVEQLHWGTRVRNPNSMGLITLDGVIAYVNKFLGPCSG